MDLIASINFSVSLTLYLIDYWFNYCIRIYFGMYKLMVWWVLVVLVIHLSRHLFPRFRILIFLCCFVLVIPYWLTCEITCCFCIEVIFLEPFCLWRKCRYEERRCSTKTSQLFESTHQIIISTIEVCFGLSSWWTFQPKFCVKGVTHLLIYWVNSAKICHWKAIYKFEVLLSRIHNMQNSRLWRYYPESASWKVSDWRIQVSDVDMVLLQ